MNKNATTGADRGWGRWAALLILTGLAAACSRAQGTAGAARASLILDAAGAIPILLAFGFLLTLPGWALLSGLWRRWPALSLFNRLVLATAAGAAIYPVLLLWTRLAGLQIGEALAWGVPVAALGSFAWRWRAGWRPAIPARKFDSLSALKWAVLLVVLVTRLIPLRDLPAGMWGDAYHHTLITQLLVERGGLFSNWAPYAPLVTMTYHFGFHSTAAGLVWLTGMGAERAVLWAGQLFGVLAVAGLAPLVEIAAERLNGEGVSAWSGKVGAITVMVVAGLIAQMPMFYINWGRYTQLAGQALLPVVLLVAMDVFEGEWRGWQPAVLSAVLVAGLGLIHYRVLVFAILWCIAYWIVQVWQLGLWQALKGFWTLGWGAALLFLPWFWLVFAGGLMDIIGTQLTTPADEIGRVIQGYNTIGDIRRYLPATVWALFTFSLILGLARRDRASNVFALWALLLLLVANPGWMGLPGAGAINNFAVWIAAYFPASLVIGFTAAWLADRFAELSLPAWKAARPVGVGVGITLLIWGGAREIGIVDPARHALLSEGDLYGFQWIDAHLPEDAVFLVNGFLTSGGNTIAGSDGGWWIPYYTKRATTMPPFIFISEKTDPPDLRERLVALYRAIRKADPGDPAILETLQSMGVTHVFYGEKQGAVNGPGNIMAVDAVAESRFFRPVYQQGGVVIFEVLYGEAP